MTQLHHAFSYIRGLPRTFWIVMMTTLINQLGNMAFVFLIVYLTQAVNFSVTEASIAFAFFSGATMFSGLIGGSLADQFGPARLMILVLIANSIVLLTFPFVTTHAGVLWHCLMWGFIYGLYKPASQTLVASLSSPGMHKITFSIYRLIINLGMSVGPAIGGYLAGLSYSSIFIMNGLANLSAGLFLFIGLRKTQWLSLRNIKKAPIEFGFNYLLKDERLLIFVLAMIPVSAVFFQHESSLPVYLHNDLGLPLKFYGMLFTINTLLIVFCELPLNLATLSWPYRVNFMLGSFFITIGFAGFYFATKASHVIFLTILWTIGEMILYPASNSFIADIAPENRRGAYMSIYSLCSNFGLLFGPVGGAYVLEKMGSNNLWIACGLFGMISLIIFYYVQVKTISHAVLAKSESI